MSTRLFSLRLDPSTLERLDVRARDTGATPSALARRYIEEGLRMDAHPDVFFQDGMTGRRAKLLAGPDVWEVINVLRHFEGSADEVVQQTVASTGLYERAVRAALRYYAAYRDEIDERIRLNDEVAERAYAEWERTQAALAP